MKFEWDEQKREENIHKHGIDFYDVPMMFEGPMLIRLDHRHEYGEERWLAIGFLGPGTAVVIYVERQADTIRIISARKANRDECKRLKNELS